MIYLYKGEINMAYILQVDFQFDGPFEPNVPEEMKDLAYSINEEPGFIWKIWTENPENKEAGGIYAFDSEAHAQQYLAMHSERLKQMGVSSINSKLFKVNDTLTHITKGQV